MIESIPTEEQEASYEAALRLINIIDRNLQRGTLHYRTIAGELLLTTDQVVQALLDNTLAVERGCL